MGKKFDEMMDSVLTLIDEYEFAEEGAYGGGTKTNYFAAQLVDILSDAGYRDQRRGPFQVTDIMAKGEKERYLADCVQEVLDSSYTGDLSRDDGEKKVDALARHIIEALKRSVTLEDYSV